MAVLEMIELLCERFGYSAVDAYRLCSVCADPRISAIVDVPNRVVSLHCPWIVVLGSCSRRTKTHLTARMC